MSKPTKPYPRPKPGAATVSTIRIPICAECRCVIDDTGLCDPDCRMDAESHRGHMFYAVYERTDKFLRDEAEAV